MMTSLIRSSVFSFLTLAISGSASLAAGNRDPGDFEGSYKLAKGHFGLCEEIVNICRENDNDLVLNMYVGSHYFTNVNGGDWVWDDQFEHRVSTASIQGSSLIQIEKVLQKPLKRRVTRKQVARISGNSMHFTATDSSNADLPLSCSYTKVPESQDNETPCASFNPPAGR